MSAIRDRLLKYYIEAPAQIDSSNYQKELYDFLRTVTSDDIQGMEEHRKFIDLIAVLRNQMESNDVLHGQNYLKTVTALLSVGADGIYTGKQRFLFELIQNVDDCDYDDITACHLRVDFCRDTISLTYNEKGFSPANVFAITGIAEAAKNVEVGKIEIGEKGLGFKSVFGVCEEVLIQSGMFSFSLNRNHFTVPQSCYEGFKPVSGTKLTLKLKSDTAVYNIYRNLADQYCTADALSSHNPMLFLNKLTELDFFMDNEIRRLHFYAERKPKEKLSEEVDVERDIKVSADLYDYFNGRDQEYHPCFTGDRYTLTTQYDQRMCRSRYGNDTRLTGKAMTLQAIYPHKEYIKAANDSKNSIEQGTLYSFMPTQVRLVTPIIMHAPFKLNGARENVDPQDKNAWYLHTLKCLISLVHQSLYDVASQRGEDVLYFIPQKQSYLFGTNEHLQSPELTGEKLISDPVLRCQDGAFHSAADAMAFDGNLPV